MYATEIEQGIKYNNPLLKSVKPMLWYSVVMFLDKNYYSTIPSKSQVKGGILFGKTL